MKRSLVMARWGVGVMLLTTMACTSTMDFLVSQEEEEISETEAWQETVDEIRTMTRGQKIPSHFIDPEKPATEDVFDPNQLLAPLDHLRLKPGYTLDFVYRYDGMGGRPILYAREESVPPYASLEDYQNVLGTDDVPYDAHLAFIESDGTPEGYFQWVLMRMMGGQFYLYWHSGYDDDEIIASKAYLESLVDQMSSTEFGVPFSSSQKNQALKIDPAPVVTIEDDQVIVRVVYFTRWGGFYESITTLTPAAPHIVIDTETNQLLEYECGVQF